MVRHYEQLIEDFKSKKKDLEQRQKQRILPLQERLYQLGNRLGQMDALWSEKEDYDIMYQDKQYLSVKRQHDALQQKIDEIKDHYLQKKRMIQKEIQKAENKIYQLQFRRHKPSPSETRKDLQKNILKTKFHKDPDEVRQIMHQKWKSVPSVLKNKTIRLSFMHYEDEDGKWTPYKMTFDKYPKSFFPMTAQDLQKKTNKRIVLYQDVEGLVKNKHWIQEQVKLFRHLSKKEMDLLIDYTDSAEPFKKKEKKNMLKDIFKKAPPLDYPLMVYRGVTYDYTTNKKYFLSNVFVSTSLELHVAFGFMSKAKQDNCCLMQILLPKGTRCLYLPILSIYPEEQEILLPADTPFQILQKNLTPLNDSWELRQDQNVYPFQKEIMKMKKTNYWKYFFYHYLGIPL